MLRPLFLIAALIVLAPSVAHACLCGLTPRASQPARERQVIFVGIALDSPESRGDPLVGRATFVTETSWRGQLPDTLVVTFEDAPCLAFFAASRYLVIAERDPARPGTVRVATCSAHIPLHSAWARRLLGSLGAPDWLAPPPGERGLDRIAVPLGEKRPIPAGVDSVFFAPPVEEATIEIGGHRGRRQANGRPYWYLAPGLYHFRLTWDDGTAYLGYVRIACEGRIPNSGMCTGTRSFLGLRSTP